jgi:hypothetical protein
MVMKPRTHPRGSPPDFELPKPNPRPKRLTDAMWWLVCMRLELEPESEHGGDYVNKAAYHNAGENLPDHGEGNSGTDSSIRRGPDREGPWWRTKTAALDWTFNGAHHGDYRTINLYMNRRLKAMKDPKDLRPDKVYAFTIGQADGDKVVEGYSEYTDKAVSGDSSHLWHIHDAFRRNIVGDFWAMWKALTIDMGWTYDEWLRSVSNPPSDVAQEEDDMPSAEDVAKAVWKHKLLNPYSKVEQEAGAILRYAPSASWHQTTHSLLADIAEMVATLGPADSERAEAITAKIEQVRVLLDEHVGDTDDPVVQD